jgi:hypothetical protein
MEAFLQIYLWQHVSFGMCVHGNCVPLVNWFGEESSTEVGTNDMKKSASFFFADVQEHQTRSGVMVQSSVLQLGLIEQGNRHSSVAMVHSCFRIVRSPFQNISRSVSFCSSYRKMIFQKCTFDLFLRML